jgi:hypothetical protein
MRYVSKKNFGSKCAAYEGKFFWTLPHMPTVFTGSQKDILPFCQKKNGSCGNWVIKCMGSTHPGFLVCTITLRDVVFRIQLGLIWNSHTKLSFSKRQIPETDIKSGQITKYILNSSQGSTKGTETSKASHKKKEKQNKLQGRAMPHLLPGGLPWWCRTSDILTGWTKLLSLEMGWRDCQWSRNTQFITHGFCGF